MSDEEVRDFIESRISKLSTRDIHYDDLLSWTDSIYPKIVKRIEEVIDQVLTEMSEGLPAEEKKKGEILEIRCGSITFKPEDLEEEGIEDEEEREVYEYSNHYR